MRKRSLLGFFILLLVVLTAVPALYAQEPVRSSSFSLEALGPDGETVIPYFILDGTQDGALRGQFRVANWGQSEGSVQLYTVDAVTGNTGGTVLKMRGDARTQVGGWIELERDVATLAPGEGQVIPFVVHIPANARAGHHIGGIVMETLDEAVPAQQQGQDEVSFQVDVQTRTAVAVQVNLPGTSVEKLDVLGLDLGGHDSQQIIYINLRNSGTQMVKTSGSLRIVDADNQERQNIRFRIDTFLPGNEIKYPIYIEGNALSAGSYTADLSLRYGETSQIYRNQHPFDVSDADNIQIFEGREALASPLTAQTAALLRGRPGWETGAIIGLGVLLTGFVIYLVVSIYQYERERKRRQQKLAQLPQQGSLPTKQPLRARSGSR